MCRKQVFFLYRTCVLSLCLGLAACGSVIQDAQGKAVEFALGAIGIKTRDKSDQALPERTLTVRLEAAANLNAGEDGKGLATVMRLYKLRDQNAFMSTPHSSFGIQDKEKQALENDLMEVRELTLSPGQVLNMKEKLLGDAAYLGVITLFHSPFPQRWRFAFATKDAIESEITVGVHACAMTATKVAPAGMSLNEAALLSPVRCK